MEVQDQHRDARNAAEREFLNRDGITGIDIGFKEVRGQPTSDVAIRFFVTEKRDVSAVEWIPPEIGGVPTDVIEQPPVVLFVDKARRDPLQGGCSLGPCQSLPPASGPEGIRLPGNGGSGGGGRRVSAGTLGAIVRDNQTGDLMVLTNYHVFAIDGTLHVGLPVVQPGLLDGGDCTRDTIAAITRGHRGQQIDAAVASLTPGLRRHVRCSILDFGDIAAARNSYVTLGETVQKRGRGTGLTVGVVDGVHGTFQDQDGVILSDQFSVRADLDHNKSFAEIGDSGSVVLADTRQPVGLLYGGWPGTGRATVNPITAVCQHLNVSFCTSAAYAYFLEQTPTAISGADGSANFHWALGDYNRDGIPDLYGVKVDHTAGNVEVHILDGGTRAGVPGPYQTFLEQIGTLIGQQDGLDNFRWAVADFNPYTGAGIPDLYGIKVSNTGTGTVEVHILNGATQYQSFLLQTGTPISAADGAANFYWALGDYNRDGIPDLYGIKVSNTGTGTVEVHILNGATQYQSFLLQTGTPISAADGAANFRWAVGTRGPGIGPSPIGRRIPDLYGIKVDNTGTGMVELHILDGATQYQTFREQIPTIIGQADGLANFHWAVGDYNRDGIPDLYGIKVTNTGGMTEVHIEGGAWL